MFTRWYISRTQLKFGFMVPCGEYATVSSCLHRASIISKTLFIVPTDAHYYKIIEMSKQFKIITLAPTCFGSNRNHHQGAVLSLVKTTNMVFLYSSV